MILIRSLHGIGLVLMLTGCTLFVAKEAHYLQSARGRATQEEVKRQLGVPKLMTTTPTGESLWVYEVREIEPGCQNSWCTSGSWCDEYVLTFDNQAVLQHWTYKSFFHGGELMPARCDSGVLKSAS